MFARLIHFIADTIETVVPTRYGDKAGKALDLLRALGDGEGERARSARMVLLTFSIRVFSAALTYASQVLFARLMGSYDYGVFVVVWTWVLILAILTALGLPTAILRLIPEFTEKGDHDRLRGVLFSSRLVAIATATLVSGLGIGVILAFPGLVEDAYTMPIVLAGVLLPMMALVEVQDGIGRAYEWPFIAFVPPFIARPVLVLICFLAALLMGFPASATTAVSSSIVAIYVVTLFQFVLIQRSLKKAVPAGPRTCEHRRWTIIALPMLAIESFLFLILNTDIVVAGWFVSPDEVAVYFAATKTLALVHFVYFATRAASAHKIATHATSGNREKLEATVQDAVKWTFWPSLVLGLFLLAIGRFILSIFGDGFEAGTTYLSILMVGVLVRASIGPAEAFLSMNGSQNQAALIYAAVFATNLVLNLVLIPWIGLTGAAIATATAMLVETVLLALIVYRRTGIVCFVGRLQNTTPLTREEPAA